MSTPPIVTLYDEYGLDEPLPPEIQERLDALDAEEDFGEEVSDRDFWS